MGTLLLYLSASLSLGFIFPKLCWCNSMPYLSMEEHKQIWKFFEEEVPNTFPSDDADTAEIVTQEPNERYGVIFYNLVSDDGVSKPVFVSVGTIFAGRNVIVLLRGADYIDPLNKDRFVVLRKRDSGEYNVHVAVIWKNVRGQMFANWENVLVSFQPGIREMVGYITQEHIMTDSFHETSIRPACGWFGTILLCDSEQKIIGRGSGIVPPRLEVRARKKSVLKAQVTDAGEETSSSSVGNGDGGGESGAISGGEGNGLPGSGSNQSSTSDGSGKASGGSSAGPGGSTSSGSGSSPGASSTSAGSSPSSSSAGANTKHGTTHSGTGSSGSSAKPTPSNPAGSPSSGGTHPAVAGSPSSGGTHPAPAGTPSSGGTNPTPAGSPSSGGTHPAPAGPGSPSSGGTHPAPAGTPTGGTHPAPAGTPTGGTHPAPAGPGSPSSAGTHPAPAGTPSTGGTHPAPAGPGSPSSGGTPSAPAGSSTAAGSPPGNPTGKTSPLPKKPPGPDGTQPDESSEEKQFIVLKGKSGKGSVVTKTKSN